MEEEQAEPPRLIIPTPFDLTDSEEEAPQSAQDPNVHAEHGGKSDHGQGATILGGPAVQAEFVQCLQTTVADESATFAEPLHPAYLAQMADEDADHVDQYTDSELEDGATKRRRNRCGIRRARIPWRIVEVIDRSQHSDAEVQNRLNELACNIYEKAGTLYPPGLLFSFLV